MDEMFSSYSVTRDYLCIEQKEAITQGQILRKALTANNSQPNYAMKFMGQKATSRRVTGPYKQGLPLKDTWK